LLVLRLGGEEKLKRPHNWGGKGEVVAMLLDRVKRES